MTKETVLADLEESTKRLLQSFAHFSPENFNEKPSETAWSAAELAEHLLKVETTANKALRSQSEAPGRPFDEKVAFLKMKMEDEAKRQAPEPVRPSAAAKDFAGTIAQLKEQREALKSAVETFDLTEACVGLPHPVAGVMTRIEWVYFVIHHTDRHLRQLKQIEEKVLAKVS